MKSQKNQRSQSSRENETVETPPFTPEQSKDSKLFFDTILKVISDPGSDNLVLVK